VKTILQLIMVFFIFISCEEDQVNKESSPYTQKNINWVSLADTPWPIYNHDVQNTNRSQFTGPPTTPSMTTVTFNKYIESALTLDSENNIYITSSLDKDGDAVVYFLNDQLELNKVFDMSDNITSYIAPIFTSDSFVYTAGWEGYLYKFDLATDSLLFSVYMDDNVWLSPSIDLSGNLIVSGDTKLQKFDQSGTVVWTNDLFRIYKSGGLSQDGEFGYFPSVSYLYKIDLSDGEILSSIPTMASTPTISNEGHLFFGSINDTSVVCTDPNLNIIWKYFFGRNNGKEISLESGTMDYDGNFYIVGQNNYEQYELLSFSFYGELNWSNELDHNQWTSLLCDSNNNIYVQGRSSVPDGAFISSFNQDGLLNWKIELPNISYEQPVISSERKIILPAIDYTPINIVVLE